MTREELIARIEAGETGPELLCAIADIAGWTPNDGSSLSEILAFYIGPKDSAFSLAGVPAWLTSLDAAIALVGNSKWTLTWTGSGHCRIWSWAVGGIYREHYASSPNNPAAALVAAWLKATA